MDIRHLHRKIATGSYDMNQALVDPAIFDDHEALVKRRQDYIFAKEALHREFKEDCLENVMRQGFDRPMAERFFQNAYDAANSQGHEAVVTTLEDLITNFG